MDDLEIPQAPDGLGATSLPWATQENNPTEDEKHPTDVKSDECTENKTERCLMSIRP